MVVVVKKWKKVKNFDKIKKIAPKYFFPNEKGYFDQKLPEESNKNGPDALQIRFLVGIGSFCCEKVIFEPQVTPFKQQVSPIEPQVGPIEPQVRQIK